VLHQESDAIQWLYEFKNLRQSTDYLEDRVRVKALAEIFQI